jgi:hypothetical protein
MNLICACCGSSAPARHQWHNRDTGYGVCRKCFEAAVVKDGIEQAIHCYGAPGIHHSTELLPTPPLKTVQALRLAENENPTL